MKSIVIAALLAAVGSAAGAETVQVGAYPANPPWQAKQPDGSFEGFEVDLVREIADRLGMEIEISDLGFQALFAAIDSGRIDMAISSISITNERLQSKSFTQGYYDSDLALISRKDGALSGLDGVEGKTIGAISTSTGERWIQQNMESYGIGEYRGYNTQADLLLDVQSGRLDGAIGDIAGFQYAFLQMPTMHVVEAIPTGDRFAIMLAKDSPLLEDVNAAISAIKEDGTMAAIHEKHLGVAPAEGVSTVTVLPIPTAE